MFFDEHDVPPHRLPVRALPTKRAHTATKLLGDVLINASVLFAREWAVGRELGHIYILLLVSVSAGGAFLADLLEGNQTLVSASTPMEIIITIPLTGRVEVARR
jgi:hypothetical protein